MPANDEPDFARLAALYAASGHRLIRTTGGYLATRWGQVKPLTNLEEAQRFLQQLSGTKHK